MAVEEAGAGIGRDVRAWLDQPLADGNQGSDSKQVLH
jgi:hypothetical protein